jgi:acetoacetyl-CoA synthetase
MLRPGVELDDALRDRIRRVIRENTTPRHVPAKIVEIAVRSVVHGEEVKNTEALANPDALQHFRDIPELGTD